jgi:hypothetical protein
LPNYSTLDTVPPTQVGRVNPFIAEVMNRRMDRMGIPANDNRRLETITAMRAQARGIAQASSALAGAGRAIGWAGAAIAAYSYTGDLYDRLSAPVLPDSSLFVPNGARVETIDGVTVRQGIRIAGKQYPGLTPAGAAPDSQRWSAQIAGTLIHFVGMPAIIRAPAHAAAIRIQIDNTVTDFNGQLVYPGVTAIIGGQQGGLPTERWEMARRQYRNEQGVMQPASTYNTTSSVNFTYTIPNGAVPRECHDGVATRTGSSGSWACSMLATADVEGLIPVTAHNAVRTLPATLATVPAAGAMIAFIIDQLWQDAAQAPGFGGAGASYSFGDPITEAEVGVARAARPDLYPQVADLAAPMCASCFGGQTVQDVPIPTVAPAPVANPGTPPNPNPTPTPPLDLGPDPGIDAPGLPDDVTWADIADPLFNMMAPPQVQLGSGQCPLFTFNALERDFDTQVLCDFAEQQRAAIGAVFLIAWSIAAAMIIIRT